MEGPRRKTLVRTLVATIIFALAGFYIYRTLRGPNGVPAMLEKQREVRRLQEKNADLQKEIQARRERIRRLSDSRSEQELEIRRRLKLLKEKETTFILQDQPKPAPASP